MQLILSVIVNIYINDQSAGIHMLRCFMLTCAQLIFWSHINQAGSEHRQISSPACHIKPLLLRALHYENIVNMLPKRHTVMITVSWRAEAVDYFIVGEVHYWVWLPWLLRKQTLPKCAQFNREDWKQLLSLVLIQHLWNRYFAPVVVQ